MLLQTEYLNCRCWTRCKLGFQLEHLFVMQKNAEKTIRFWVKYILLYCTFFSVRNKYKILLFGSSARHINPILNLIIIYWCFSLNLFFFFFFATVRWSLKKTKERCLRKKDFKMFSVTGSKIKTKKICNTYIFTYYVWYSNNFTL